MDLPAGAFVATVETGAAEAGEAMVPMMGTATAAESAMPAATAIEYAKQSDPPFYALDLP